MRSAHSGDQSALPASQLRKRVWFAIALAPAIRAVMAIAAVWFVDDPARFAAPDTPSYLLPTQNLIDYGRFDGPAGPELVRTPGYPIFLVPGILVGRVAPVTIVLQLLLSALTALVILRIGCALFDSQQAGLWAAVLYAVEPLSVLFSLRLLTETLFTTLVVLSVALALQYLKRRTWTSLMGAAISICAAAYVRPIGLPLPLVVASVIAWPQRRSTDDSDPKQTSRNIRRQLAIFLASSLLLLGIWPLRNAIRADFWGFSAVTDENVYFYQAATVLAREEKKSFEQVRSELGFADPERYNQLHPEQSDWTPAERYRWMREQGWAVLRGSPALYAEIHAQGLARTIADPGATGWVDLFTAEPQTGGLLAQSVDRGLVAGLAHVFQDRPVIFWSTMVSGLVLGCYYLGALVAIPRAWRDNTSGTCLLLVVSAYLWLASGGPMATARFRHPLMPVVCVLAGATLSRAITHFRSPTVSA